ncbi:hypothetical protein FQV39_22645 [Bosea sp. F3-2]|uniref:hypothetical protein n=1 Tax=Bosea sp. F3-2 TaxID=2599640 RepID=UPI0011EF9E61|nr:hypothetical protein [Bosea sp. F3-2]QEL25083.1 hypothetical protein FQV39_22645 [Bosea sp. F3-2]
MLDLTMVDAALIDNVEWITPAGQLHVAFKFTAPGHSQVFLLDRPQAEKLAAGLNAYMPAPAGDEVQIDIPAGLVGEHEVTATSIDTDEPRFSGATQGKFHLRLTIGDRHVTMTMSHSELLRLVAQMQAKLQEHRVRTAN